MRIVRDMLATLVLASLALTFTMGCGDDDDDNGGTGTTGPAALHGVWRNIAAETTTTVELLANGNATYLEDDTVEDECSYMTYTYEADDDSIYIENQDMGNAAYALSNNGQTLTVHPVDDSAIVFTKIAAMPDLTGCSEFVPGGMSATIGGTVVEFAFAEGVSTGTTLIITAVGANPTRTLTIGGLPLTAGTYALGGNQSQIVMIYTSGQTQYSTNTLAPSGTITIAFDGSRVSGTFSGEVFQPGLPTVTITNGTFNVNINEN